MSGPCFAVLPCHRQVCEEDCNVRCVRRHRFGTHSVGSEIAQYLLSRSHLLKKAHRIEFFELRLQFLLDSGFDAVVRQKPIARRRWREVDLVHACAIARLGLQLERGLEEVNVLGLTQKAAPERGNELLRNDVNLERRGVS